MGRDVIRVGTLFNSNQGGAVYDVNGIAPCLGAAFHGYANGYIVMRGLGSEYNITTDGKMEKHLQSA